MAAGQSDWVTRAEAVTGNLTRSASMTSNDIARIHKADAARSRHGTTKTRHHPVLRVAGLMLCRCLACNCPYSYSLNPLVFSQGGWVYKRWVLRRLQMWSLPS